jgi:hypothetical protein
MKMKWRRQRKCGGGERNESSEKLAAGGSVASAAKA